MAWLFEQAIQPDVQPGDNFTWNAPILNTAKIAYRRFKRGLPQGTYTPRDGDVALVLLNQAIIWFRSGENADSLYGDDAKAAVIDEGSRYSEEAYHAVRSTLVSTQGKLRVIGNVKGRRNWFYRLARQAEAGTLPNSAYYKLTAYDAAQAIKPDGRPVLAPDEIEAFRATTPEAVFRELMLAEPSEDEGNPFGLAHIAACTVEKMSTADPVVWGVDVARIVDYMVAIGLDAQGDVCRLLRWRQESWESSHARIIAAVGEGWCLIESNGPGDAVVEAVQKYCQRVEGFYTTNPSKQRLMEGLAVDIQQRQVKFPKGVLTKELEDFEYQLGPRGAAYYSAPEGQHDDCVMALALARQMFRQVFAWRGPIYLSQQGTVAQTNVPQVPVPTPEEIGQAVEGIPSDQLKIDLATGAFRAKTSEEAEPKRPEELTLQGGAWFPGDP